MVKGKMDKGIKIVKNFYFPRSTNKKSALWCHNDRCNLSVTIVSGHDSQNIISFFLLSFDIFCIKCYNFWVIRWRD